MVETSETFLGGLLVGGASRRMGEPKALADRGDGRSLAEGVADALRPHVGGLVLLGEGPVPTPLAGLPRLADAPLPGAGGSDQRGGPLAGILAALRHRPDATWIVCPCDLPLVEPRAVKWLIGHRHGAAAVLPGAGPDLTPQPLFALYTGTALPLLEELASSGRRGPSALAGRPGVSHPRVPRDLDHCWRDADTPQELASLVADPDRHGVRLTGSLSAARDSHPSCIQRRDMSLMPSPSLLPIEALPRSESRRPDLPPDPGTSSAREVALTVAITVWKREQLLAHALQSVLRQSRPAAEVLVLSDGPSRAAREMVDTVADRLPIRYLDVQRRRKTWGNHLRRRALEEARSSHLVILGHDCLLHKDCLATHHENLAGDVDGLSIVQVDYWRGTEPDGRMPRHSSLSEIGEGEIDLLCMALPRHLALAEDCFGEDMMRIRCADYLSFRRLCSRTPPRYAADRGPQAAHF